MCPPTLPVMRFPLLALLALVAVAASRAADVEFIRVWPGWRDAESFERVSEFFTGRENSGGQVIRRTHPKERDGFYFLIRVKNPAGAVSSAKFSLQVIAPGDPLTKKFSFPASLPAGTTVFNLGLTGSDWTDRKNPPVAWKLELIRDDGQVLATEKSFLWEMPAK
jgi:hypothetical protein